MLSNKAICLVAVLWPSFAVCHARIDQGRLLKPRKSFIQDSIFANRDDIYAIAAEPDLHVYDDFNQDIPYSGIAYFAHLNATNCFSQSSNENFDIGIVGAPFDLGVTYRPGARFGPAGTRMGSRRLSPSMGYRFVQKMKLILVHS